MPFEKKKSKFYLSFLKKKCIINIYSLIMAFCYIFTLIQSYQYTLFHTQSQTEVRIIALFDIRYKSIFQLMCNFI